MSVSLTYQLVTEYFAPKYRTRAYFSFSISKQLSESIKYLTPILISTFGWKISWMIGGGIGVVSGLLLVLTVSEPNEKKEIILTSNKN